MLVKVEPYEHAEAEPQWDEDHLQYRDGWFYRYVRWLLRHMMVAGVSPGFHWNNPQSKASRAGRIYCGIIVSLHWLNTLRYCFAFKSVEVFGPVLFMKLTLMLNFFQASVFATTTATQGRKIERFLQDFYETNYKHKSEEIKEDYSDSLKTVCKSMLVFYISLYICIVGTFFFLGAANLTDNAFMESILAPLPTTSPAYLAAAMLFGWYFLYFFGAWGGADSMFIAATYIIVQEFNKVNDWIKNAISKEGEVKGSIESMRRRHDAVCRIVDTADDIFTWYIGVSCSSTILLIGITLYSFAFGETNAITIGVLVWQMLTVVVLILTILFGGVLINSKAHAVTADVYRINMEKLAVEDLHRVHIFLARLIGPPIGVSAMKLFTIDRGAVLTVFGTIVTYGVVVFQFHQTTDPTEAFAENMTTISPWAFNTTV